MANYSTTADLLELIPDATGIHLFDSDTFTADYDALASGAYDEINSFIGQGTATPSSQDLAEVEAMLVAHRRVTAVYGSVDQEGSEPFRQNWKKRAYELLSNWIFPACASTPVQNPEFTGDGTISVSVFDHWTADGNWMVRCSTAGTTGAVFQVWCSRWPSRYMTYTLTDTTFPGDSYINTGDPLGLALQLRITITPGSTAFAVGDTWTFRTYSRWKKGQKKSNFRMVDTRRSG